MRAMLRTLAALVLVAACSHSPPPVARAAPPAAKPPACARPVAGLTAQLKAGAILWFGEIHGSEESPRFVGDVACAAAAAGRVQVGLEIPGDEQPRIDAFLKSAGSPADRATLFAGPFWRHHDGRTSTGMAALLEQLRVLHAEGAALDVVAYDVPEADDRDTAMAEQIAKRRDPAAVFVGLSGNIHSRRTKGTPWNADLVPMVAQLVARGLAITTYDVSWNGGAFWACIATSPTAPQDCGPHESHQHEPGEPWTLGPARDASHDGVYRIGAATAAAPAVP
jgi:hypothetical protein